MKQELHTFMLSKAMWKPLWTFHLLIHVRGERVSMKRLLVNNAVASYNLSRACPRLQRGVTASSFTRVKHNAFYTKLKFVLYILLTKKS